MVKITNKNKGIDRTTLAFIRLLYNKGYRAVYVESVSKNTKVIKNPFSLISIIKKAYGHSFCVHFIDGNNDKSILIFKFEKEKLFYSVCAEGNIKEINNLCNEAKIFDMLDYFVY